MSIGSEQTITTTIFGTVTDRRIKYLVNKSWFGGGSEEDIPLRHVTSVRLETNRHPIIAVILALFAIGCFAAGGAGIFFGILLAAVVVFLLWGSPRVVVNTAGGDLRPSSGFPWVKAEAEKFVKALRGQLFDDSGQAQVQTTVGAAAGGESAEEKLTALDNLRSKGIINEDEYAERRKAILDRF